MTSAMPAWITLQHQGLAQRAANPLNCLLFIDPQRHNAEFLARQFMQAVLCDVSHEAPCGQCQSCHLFQKNAHPDAIFVPEPGKIDDVRALIQKTNLTPTIAKSRLIFLGKIDEYNDFALSALLKTLEEPSPHSAFILSAANRRAVKPTILSRAQIIHAPQPSPEQSLAWLTGEGLAQDLASRLLITYHGNPYLAKAAADDNSDDPLQLLAPLAAFLAAPKTHLAFLNQIEQLDKTMVIATLCLNLEIIIAALQTGNVPNFYQHAKQLASNLPHIEAYPVHRLYAELCTLRRPDKQQINLTLAAKALFTAHLKRNVSL